MEEYASVTGNLKTFIIQVVYLQSSLCLRSLQLILTNTPLLHHLVQSIANAASLDSETTESYKLVYLQRT